MQNERLVELEIKLAFQEDLVQELNTIVANQQRMIDNLEKICRILAERMDSFNSQQLKHGGQEVPPHY